MNDTAKAICREICAYKGEQSCFESDAKHGRVWLPCEECEPVAAWHDAEIAALKHDIERYVASASDHAAEVERLKRECNGLKTMEGLAGREIHQLAARTLAAEARIAELEKQMLKNVGQIGRLLRLCDDNGFSQQARATLNKEPSDAAK